MLLSWSTARTPVKYEHVCTAVLLPSTERVCNAPNAGVETMVRGFPFSPLHVSVYCTFVHLFLLFSFSRDGEGVGGVREAIRQRLDVGKRGETKVRLGLFSTIFSTTPQGLSHFSEAFGTWPKRPVAPTTLPSKGDTPPREVCDYLPARQSCRTKSNLVCIRIDSEPAKGFRRLSRDMGYVSSFSCTMR